MVKLLLNLLLKISLFIGISAVIFNYTSEYFSMMIYHFNIAIFFIMSIIFSDYTIRFLEVVSIGIFGISLTKIIISFVK